MSMTIRNPRTMFRVAMACLALFGLLGFSRLSAMFNEDLLDGLRGALLGATLALIYLTFRLQRRRDGDRS